MTRAEKSRPAERLRLLIADASAASRVDFAFLISERTNIEVAGFAWSGVDTLKLIRKMKPDVVTLDLGLPELNGFEVLAALQKEKLNTTVIVLTGRSEAGTRQRCLALGVKHFFHKTTDFTLVIAVLKEYAGRQSGKRKERTLTQGRRAATGAK
ncbi:MAG: two component LuxR family transcriptional regulator [Pedosphaera sp.]|nr:two component LuxR family transcriptional regulator [Pedosphaera sp.]